eukprot:m.33096 g.33096  ORF g.33096 m.33096 type:complete len:231 (+) comp8487_c0_seq2:191-883(+)
MEGHVQLLDEESLQGYAEAISDAFANKRDRWCGWCGSTTRNSDIAEIKGTAKRYWPIYSQQVGIYKTQDGRVLGAIIVKLHDQPADPSLPPCMKHNCTQGECYVEQIGVSADARGRGVGKKLMEWADSFAVQKNCNRLANKLFIHSFTFSHMKICHMLCSIRITLAVSRSNRAIRLYERQGYVNKGDSCGSCGPVCCVVWQCFIGEPGFNFMEKPLIVKRPSLSVSTQEM